MRIDSSTRPAYVVDISGVSGVSGAAPAAAPVAPRPTAKSVDRVEISPQAQELARLKKALDALPDVRLDRVALARQQMQYGPYRVDPALVARKMMQDQTLQGDDL